MKSTNRNAATFFSCFIVRGVGTPKNEIWMGYERKRGKLADLNAFLRGGAHERFSLIVGDTTSLGEVKYVITLDPTLNSHEMPPDNWSEPWRIH